MHWHLPPYAWWVLGPFLAWRVAVRLRRLLTRQRYSNLLLWARAAGLAALVAGVAIVAFAEQASFIALCIGCAVGAGLGLYGVRITQFERQAGVTFFHPNLYLGAALSVLLIGRLLWRAVTGPIDSGANWTLEAFLRNPSTMLLFGLFSAHFIAYSLGVIRRMTRTSHDGQQGGPASS